MRCFGLEQSPLSNSYQIHNLNWVKHQIGSGFRHRGQGDPGSVLECFHFGLLLASRGGEIGDPIINGCLASGVAFMVRRESQEVYLGF